jgi:hypothetical protein
MIQATWKHVNIHLRPYCAQNIRNFSLTVEGMLQNAFHRTLYSKCDKYVGVSKSFEGRSIVHQPMAVRERVRCAWE